jgi:prepilin peptidase CpaA
VSLGGFGLLWYFGGMGAGDVKLLAAVGALKGLPFILNASLYVLFAAAMAGIVLLAARGRLKRTLKWVGLVFASLLVPGIPRPALEGEKTHMPFAPFIFIGVTIAAYLEFANGPFTL